MKHFELNYDLDRLNKFCFVHFDTNEAEIDFINAVSENDESIYSVLYQESLVGIALSDEGKYAFG